MGSRIARSGDVIEIVGTKELEGAQHKVIPDRIETGTFMIAGALGKNRIKINNCIPSHNDFLISLLRKMDSSVTIKKNQLIVKAPEKLQPVNIETRPYPEFPTDLQALMTTLLTQVQGNSTLTENIFDNRFQHIHELNKMGAKIEKSENRIFIKGKTNLTGCELNATDLRASAALVLAGTIAKGTTTVNNAIQLFRGYENITEKLNKLGANITISGSN
jgi:UDP-N-acetylglucosamine 1-carboxyvinyltransferase